MEHQIIFSTGGGYYPYFMGIAQYLQETYELSNCIFGGTSAGVHPALALSSNTSALDIMNEIALEHLKNVKKCKTGTLFNWKEISKDSLDLAMKKFIDAESFEKIQKQMYVGVYDIFEKQFKFLSNFKTKDHLVKSIIASYTIPLILTKFHNCYEKIDGHYYLDGGFGSNCKFAVICENRNVIRISPETFQKTKIFNFWPSTNIEHNMGLFWKGYQDAKINSDYFRCLKLKSSL